MTEQEAAGGEKKRELRSMTDVLRSLTGKVMTVSNPESLEGNPLGYQIKSTFYRAKILNVFDEMLVVLTETTKSGSKTEKSPTKQFIPITAVKRVCLLKDELHLHL